MLRSGQTIAGKYRLNQPIGAGGMASVWSATNTFTEREFAIKFLHPTIAKTSEAAHRFMMEAKVSARVNHPNIIDILDVGQAEDGALFLVMELLRGVSLDTALRRQTPPMLVHEFLSVMVDVARALAAAHKNGVIHRDLKPTNIFLHMIREGVAVPKVLDFGVSKFLEEEQNHSLTVAGTVLGSPLYMSPEQAMGASHTDGRTDVFAFGAILFEALCGYRPYDAPNFNALIVTIATTEPRSIDVCAPHVPETLRALVRGCLVTKKQNRIGTFDEIVDRLLIAIPELEESGARLPIVRHHEGPPSDPDATNALPVMRVSDHPRGMDAPAPGVHISSPPGMTGASPPGAFSSPWGGDAKETTLLVRPPTALIAAMGGVIGALALVIVIVLARGISSRPAKATPGAPSIAVTHAPPAPLPTSNDPPIVNVDSLPVASSKSPSLGKGLGRVVVVAAQGSCAVAIDGRPQGNTPLAPVTLMVGSHELVCTTPTGAAKTMIITVSEGTTSKFRVDVGRIEIP